MGVKLVGQYQIDKSNLLRSGLHLVIGTRKHPTLTKPKNYLLHRSGRQQRYLSSLYPVQDAPSGHLEAQNWQFDYEGEGFVLSVDPAGNLAEIKPLQGGGGQIP